MPRNAKTVSLDAGDNDSLTTKTGQCSCAMCAWENTRGTHALYALLVNMRFILEKRCAKICNLLSRKCRLSTLLIKGMCGVPV